MPISVKCGCGQSFKAKDELAGKNVKCPKCQKPLTIPGAKAAAVKAAAPSGPKELSLDDLAMLDASSPALSSGVMQPAGPQAAAGGAFQAAGFQQPAGFQQAGFAFGNQQAQPQQKKAGAGGKGKVIALSAAGGGAVIAVVIAVMLMMNDGDKPDHAEKTGTGPPPGISGPSGPGPIAPPGTPGTTHPGTTPGGTTPGTAPPSNPNGTTNGGTPGTTDPMNGSATGASVSGSGQDLPIVRDTAVGKPLVIPGAFSIDAARPYFQWKFLQQITDQELTASMYHCRQENSPAGVMLMATSKTAAHNERQHVVRQWIDALSGSLKSSGLNNVQVSLPALSDPVPDRVDVTITGALPGGSGAASIRCAVLFKKNTYALLSIGTSQQETDTMFAVADTLKEVGESSGAPTSNANRDFAQALQEWHKRPEAIVGLRYIADPEYNSDEKREQLRKPMCFSWMVDLLPYLEMQAEYARLDFKHASAESPNREVGSIVVPQFINPANNRQTAAGFDEEEGLALTHFVGMAGVELAANDDAGLFPRSHPQAGMFGYAEVARIAEVTDGASQTIMVIGSDGIAAKPWIFGGGGTVRGARMGGLSGQESYFSDLGGSMFALEGQSQPGTLAMMVDGSVRFVPKSIDPAVFRAMCTIHGSDTVDLNAAPASEQKIGGP